LTFKLNAAMVTLLVVETGLNPNEPKKSQSQNWENNLMDAFFNAGHIVSNSPIMRLEAAPKDDFKNVIFSEADAAIEGGADYIILAHLKYASGENTPSEIALYLYSLYPIEKIYENNFTGVYYGSRNDESNSIQSICRGLIPHVK